MDVSETRRLAFIRYLYLVGERQSRHPEPFGSAALLTFHDAVELFLQLASEKLDASSKNTPIGRDLIRSCLKRRGSHRESRCGALTRAALL